MIYRSIEWWKMNEEHCSDQAEKQVGFNQASLLKQMEVKPDEWKQTVNRVVHDLTIGPP